MKTISVKDLSTLIGVSTHLIYKLIKEHSLPVVPMGNKKSLPPESVRAILEIRGFKFVSVDDGPLVIVFCGLKGGIGKSSLATSTAEGGSRIGFKTLAVDLDEQSNFTQSFNKKKRGQPVLYHVIKGDIDAEEAIVHVSKNLDIIPSSLDNSQIEHVLNSQQSINITNYFNELFKGIKDKYDLIVIDCPPSNNKITICAACYAGINIIPVNADIDSFDGVVMTVSEFENVERAFKNLSIKIPYKILFNKYDAREKLSLDIMGRISERPNLKDNLMPVVIRTSTAFKNTKAEGEYVFDCRRSTSKEDCFAFISEITGVSQWVANNKKTSNIKQNEEAYA